MDWSRATVAFASPFLVWLLTFAVLAVQTLFLLFVETRIASGVLDKKFSDYGAAIFGIATLFQYDRGVALPLMTKRLP